MLGRGQTLVERRNQAVHIPGKKRVGIEPETGEDFGTEHAVRSRIQRHQPVLSADEPADFGRIDRHDDVFQHPGPLIVFKLRPEVDFAAGGRHLDSQLRGAAKILALVAALTAAFGEDPQQDIGLRLTLVVKKDRGVARRSTPDVARS